MRIVAFFSAIAVIILLLAGCGHEKSNNSQVVNLVQLGGVEYPEIPKSNIIQYAYLQPIITQYFIDNKSEIWLLFLIAHSKR